MGSGMKLTRWRQLHIEYMLKFEPGLEFIVLTILIQSSGAFESTFDSLVR